MPISSLLLTYAALVLIIWARYFVVAGIFYWMLWGRPEDKVHAVRLSSQTPRRDVVAHEIRMSVMSSVIYAIPGAIVIEAYKLGGTKIYADFNGPMELIWAPISIDIYMFIHDTYFYWTHRGMHHPGLFRIVHSAHHRSRNPTPWAGFSFHPWEAVIGAWPLAVAAFFIPIHISAVFFLLVFMTVTSVMNHAGWEILPRRLTDGLLGRWFISASHHNLHHTDYNANFGLYFRFWDRLMGTDKGFCSPLGFVAEAIGRR
jgi:lathosterol oxidase